MAIGGAFWISALLQLVAGTPVPVEHRIAAGTEVQLMVLTEVTSSVSPGQPFKLRLDRPLQHGDIVLLPAGASARGEVVDRRGSGVGMQRGRLSVRITTLAVGDIDIPLDAMIDVKGRGGRGDDAAKILLAPIYAPFARGNAAKLKAGDLVTARLAADLVFRSDEAGRWVLTAARQ